jgi:HD-GYP domain-containing protein (c-di-GMP phosphodiesterase class II)
MGLDQKVLQRLNEIGIALSKEHRRTPLLEMILTYAIELTQADGGTVYIVTPENKVHFEIAISSSLGLHVGGTSNVAVPFEDLPLFLEEGAFNDNLMVTFAVNHKKTIKVKDAYYEKGFNFAGTRAFDEKTGYRTRAVLTVPIKNHENDVIAGLQLINPPGEGGFTEADVQLAESLASQAGVALTNQFLIHSLRRLFESLIRVLAEAIDEKSPSTGNHSKRVPLLAELLAEAVNATSEGPLKDVHFSREEIYELKIASFLHDCGKITTPVYIIEKQAKLQTLFDRIELVRTRYAVLRQKTEKELLVRRLNWFELNHPREFAQAQEACIPFESAFHEKVRQNEIDLLWLEEINRGKEPITDATFEKLKRIAATHYGADVPLLTPDELENLSIRTGNLTEREQEIIHHHVVMTYKMLSQLDFPKELRQVPEIAASHHERVDGQGYPRGLKKEQMSLQARILVVADIFEALSAPDRPYKAALPLSEVLQIMQKMVETGHLDPDIYAIFRDKKAYLPYAQKFLSPEQIDIKNN